MAARQRDGAQLARGRRRRRRRRDGRGGGYQLAAGTAHAVAARTPAAPRQAMCLSARLSVRHTKQLDGRRQFLARLLPTAVL